MRRRAWPERVVVGLLAALGVALYVVAWSPDWGSMDTSDVVALTAVVAAVIVGVAGLVCGVLIAKTDRRKAAELAIQDRRQARVEDAYVELLTFVAAAGAWAQALLPAASDPADPARDAPALPEAADEWSMTAKVAAFGSAEVRRALEEWRDSLTEVRRRVRTVQQRDDRGPADRVERWRELDEQAKPAERVARSRLEALVAAELDALKQPAA